MCGFPLHFAQKLYKVKFYVVFLAILYLHSHNFHRCHGVSRPQRDDTMIPGT